LDGVTGVEVGVGGCVFVAVGIDVLVAVGVFVGVRVTVGVLVTVGVFVFVGVFVRVGVFVAVGKVFGTALCEKLHAESLNRTLTPKLLAPRLSGESLKFPSKPPPKSTLSVLLELAA
jgi:hypothetical protein